MRTRWRKVAHVAKTHGKRGEVVVAPDRGLPCLMQVGLRVACVPPLLRHDRFHVVERVSDAAGTGQLVALSGVGSIGDAAELVGRSLLVAEEDLPEDFDELDLEGLVGRSVVDDRLGELGQIEEIMVGAANDVWVVRGPMGEVMVPAVPEFVEELPEEGPIAVSLPDGIVGL